MRLIHEQTSEYEVNFLNEKVRFWCIESDLIHLINYMTMIEIHGSLYRNKFNKLSNYNSIGHIINLPIELITHMDNYLIIYERDININSLLS